jgi:simple sugar transport system permease protein
VELIGQLFDIQFVATAIRLASPLILAALGGLIAERAGVFNIALEGMMLFGALAASLAAYYTGLPVLGLVAAMVAGALTGLLLAIMSVTLRADQIISGLAINLLALGLTTYIVRLLFGITAGPVRAPAFEPIPLPVLGSIPVLGSLFFSHQIPVYLAYILGPVLVYFLFHTRSGLEIRAVGEHAHAADAAGLRVKTVRYRSVIASGAVAALGGGVLSIGLLSVFTDNITNGRGYIALAAIIFGNWHPMGVILGCLLFGAAEALGLRALGLDLPIPYQVPAMLTYVATVLVLSLFVRRTHAPAEGGKPFHRE